MFPYMIPMFSNPIAIKLQSSPSLFNIGKYIYAFHKTKNYKYCDQNLPSSGNLLNRF